MGPAINPAAGAITISSQLKSSVGPASDSSQPLVVLRSHQHCSSAALSPCSLSPRGGQRFGGNPAVVLAEGHFRLFTLLSFRRRLP